MVIGKRPVDVAIHFRDLATEPAKEQRRERAGNAVAAVDGDPHPARDANVADDPVEVGGGDVVRPVRAGSRAQRARFDARLQRPDLIARQRLAVDDHLEPVVVRWIVAARHHHAAVGAEVMRGEVSHGRRHHSDVDDIGARRADSFSERRRKRGTRKPAVAPDDEGVAPALLRQRAERLPDGAHDLRRQRAADDPADVVRLENLGGEHRDRHGVVIGSSG